jgi:cytochrome c oxidase cbb3-type subunit 3
MKKIIPAYIRVPLLFAVVFAGMEYFIDSGSKPAFIEYPMVSLFLGVFLFLLIAIEIVVSAIDKATYLLLTDAQKKQVEEIQFLPFTEGEFYKNWIKKLTRSKAIEQEEDVMLDHDYDGIKELDNVLPPWWVYLFYSCIVFAIVYLVRFEVIGDYNQKEEFEAEMVQADLDIKKYLKTAPDLMDKENVTLLADAASLAQGKAIYTTNCVVCHRADGGGAIGPNLTDKYWILGGGIKNVFSTLVNGGRSGKGMISWKDQLKPTEMQKVASYVLSLQGSNPKEPKAIEPEAVLYEDKEAAESDETKTETVVDSTTTR